LVRMDYLSLVVTAVVVFTGLYYYARRGLDFFKKHGIPHVPPLPIFGNMGNISFKRETATAFLKKMYNIHPDAKYVGFYEFTNPIVLLRDLDLIKSITIKNFETFPDHRPIIKNEQDSLFGRMLFFKSSEDWKDLRHNMSPVFTSSKIKGMFTHMSNVAVYFSNYMSKIPEKEQEIELKAVLTKYTNDVIATCVFGIGVNSIEDPNNAIYVNGRGVTNFSGPLQYLKFLLIRNWPSLVQLLNIKFVPAKREKYFEDLIVDTMNQREKNGIYRPDMMQYLIEVRKKSKAERQLTDKDMASQAFGFFFGGYETVASQACSTIHNIVTNPEVQERLQQEIDQILEKTQGQITYDTIVGMEYLDAVLNESLRMYPSSLFLDRVCMQDFELPPTLPGHKPFIAKKGTNVWIPVYAIQTDPNYFEDPEKFNPERFLQDGKRIASSGTFIPFGVGPRSCIGNRFALIEIKVLLFHLFARCDLKPCSRTNIPLKMAKGVLGILSENGFWLKVEPR
ncbi:Cytochrome P450 9e2, partial [Dufourea novaeangliae]